MRNFRHSALTALQSAALSHRLGGNYAVFQEGPQAGRTATNDCDEAEDWKGILDRYLIGWAEADPDKIAATTAPRYCFEDPLVGRFSRGSLPAYFEYLQSRFSRGASPACDYAFHLSGPMDVLPHHRQRDYFREAPALGLSGIATITVGRHGVVAERVAYDLNLASDVLRSAPMRPAAQHCRWHDQEKARQTPLRQAATLHLSL